MNSTALRTSSSENVFSCCNCFADQTASLANSSRSKLTIVYARERRERVGSFRHMIEHPLRGGGSDAGQQMQQPKSRDAVSRILDEAQQRQHVFDVCGVEKLQSTEFDERDVPARQLDFERPAVTGCPEQNCLLFEEGAGLPVLQDAFHDEARLVSLVADRDELRLCFRGAFGPEVFGEAFLGEADDAVGGGEDRLCRAVIAIERDDVCRRRKLVRKVEDVANGCGSERIDRLGVVADHCQAPATWL